MAAGRASVETLRALEDRAIDEVLQKQRDIGLDVLTDGEMRRGSWLTDMAEAVEGFVPSRVAMTWKGPGGSTETSTANAAGAKLRKTRMLTAHEAPHLLRAARRLFDSRSSQTPAQGRAFKITLPAPSNFMIASYKPGITDRAYPTRQALLDDIVQIIRDEVRWLVDQGVTYIQFDAPFYSNYLDPQHRGRLAAQGVDPDRELAAAVAGDNAALADIPRESVTCAMHVCRGNSRSRWYAEGGYDAIAERLFGSVDVDTFLLEYDDERSGGFEPLRHLPAGRNVVLGLITTKQPVLELPADLRRRIDEAARHVPLERLAISPQCGFASVASGNLLSMDDQWRKLELVVKTARDVWTV